MPNWSHIHFEGKHVDEKVLHFARPAKAQTILEVSKIIIALIVIELVMTGIYWLGLFSWGLTILVMSVLGVIAIISIFYKLYRIKRNFLYITSKRIMFHGINGLFGDHMRKITLSNIRNVDYQTESLLGRICGYGTLIVQTANDTGGDNHIWHINDARMLTHYIDKLISLKEEDRSEFNEFDASYFKNWKQEWKN